MPAASRESADYPLSRQPMMLARYHKEAKLHYNITKNNNVVLHHKEHFHLNITQRRAKTCNTSKCKYAGIYANMLEY